MAEEETATEKESGQEDEQEGSSKKKLIIIIAAAALVLVLGGGAAFFMMGSSSDSPEDASANTDTIEGETSSTDEGGAATNTEVDGDGTSTNSSDEEQGEESGPQITFGSTFSLEPFNINLGNPLENRYVRMQIAFEYRSGESQLKELEARLPQLRDAIISVTSKKTREFLLGPDGKDQLRLEILNRVNQYLDRKVEAAYIMDILIE